MLSAIISDRVIQNILVIKLRYTGDVLLATPVLRSLRDHYPLVRLTMAVNRETEPILAGNPDLSEIIIVDRLAPLAQIRLLADIRRRRFDAVIDLSDGDRSAIMAWVSGAPIRVGFNDERRWRGLLYTTAIQSPAGHRVKRDLAAIRVLGIEPKDDRPVLRLTAEEQKEADVLLKDMGLSNAGESGPRPLVLLHPGARYWFKSWPVERFAELADRLSSEQGSRVLVGGGPGDQKTAESIREQAQSEVTVLAGRVNVRQFAGVLTRCAMFIGNDNGAMHIAAAVGTPVVGLFGPSHPVEWGPRAEQAAVIYKGIDCRACFHPTCLRGNENCMRQISVDEVYAAARKFLVRGSTFEVQSSGKRA